MGTTGTGILDNDEALDLKYRFYALYNQGKASEEVKRLILKEFCLMMDGEPLIEDQTDSWLSYALCAWEIGEIDDSILTVIRKIVETNMDLDAWAERGGTEKDLNSRKKKLDDFIQKLASPPQKIKKRVKPKTAASPYQKGDCIAFKLNNGNYGVSICLWSTEGEVELPGAGIVSTRINQANFPNLNDVKNSYLAAEDCDSEDLEDQIDELLMKYEMFSFRDVETAIETQQHISETQIIGKIETYDFLNNKAVFEQAGVMIFSGLDNPYIGPSQLFESEDEPNLFFKIQDMQEHYGK